MMTNRGGGEGAHKPKEKGMVRFRGGGRRETDRQFWHGPGGRTRSLCLLQGTGHQACGLVVVCMSAT